MLKHLYRVAILFLFVALGSANVGCMFSIGYHTEMLFGDVEPRPFPIIRYWSEYSAEEFHDNVLAVPLVGIPGVIPLGYIGDFCVDTIFFSLDFVLSILNSEPYIKVNQEEMGYNVIHLYSGNTQIHYDEAFIKGAIPLKIDLKKGKVTIIIKTSSSNIIFHVYPREIRHFYKDYYGRTQSKIYSRDLTPLILWCFPKNSGMPQPLFLYLIDSEAFSPSTSFSFTDEQINLPYQGARLSLYNEKTCIMKVIYSSDFEGECSYNGKPVSEIRFIYN